MSVRLNGIVVDHNPLDHEFIACEFCSLRRLSAAVCYEDRR